VGPKIKSDSIQELYHVYFLTSRFNMINSGGVMSLNMSRMKSMIMAK
jgi:hypothetical protein